MSGVSATGKPARTVPLAPKKTIPPKSTCPWFGGKCKFLPSGKCTHSGSPPSGGPLKAKPSPSPAAAGASAEVLTAMRNLRVAQRELELALAGSTSTALRPRPPHGGHTAHPAGTETKCRYDGACTRKDCKFQHTAAICRHHLRGGCERNKKGTFCAFRHPHLV
jgi:hypothetical protein